LNPGDVEIEIEEDQGYFGIGNLFDLVENKEQAIEEEAVAEI